MGVFPGFGAWSNQNNQQPLNAESSKSQNDKTKLFSEKGTDTLLHEYYDEGDGLKQDELWHEAEKKLPWYDAPPKMKVTTKNGLCHMHIEFTVRGHPDGVYFLLTERPTTPFFDVDKWRELLQTKSSKILKDDGPRRVAKLKKLLAWEFLWWSVNIPIHVIVDENRKDLTAKYKTEKMITMKVFEGNYKVDPIYVDQERLCKHMLPKTREENKKCSGGQGRIASKVTMDQYFQPIPLLNLPPFSWYIRRKPIKTTETLIITFQKSCAMFRIADRSSLKKVAEKTSSNKHEKH